MIKVVWICNFSNYKIQNHLKLLKRIDEFAPWISLGIEEVKKHNDIELHVISPHRWMIGIKEFEDDNIYYHFFNSGIPFYGRHWPGFFRFDILTNYYLTRLRIKEIVKNIKPDIIHLHGIENAYYSTSVLDLLKKYPIIATIQGFISLHNTEGNNDINYRSRVKVEKMLIKKISYFGIRDNQMKEIILSYNPIAKLFWHEYFMNVPLKINELKNSDIYYYDLVFFSRVTKSKGIEDLIDTTGIIVKVKPKLQVVVMGSCDPSYLQYLKNYAITKKCLHNITFLGFQKTQDDIYKILKHSKIAILPTYNDNVPGLVIESMLRKVPVVSYKTGGIPEINNNDHNIELVDQGDVNGLVSKVVYLLDNPNYSKELAEKAYNYASYRWNNAKALDDVLTAYKSILKI